MKTNFLENNWVVHVAPASVIAAAEDINVGNAHSDVMSLKNADGAVFMHITCENAGGNATLYVTASDDASGTTTVAVSFRYKTIQAPNTILATGEATSLLTSTAGDIVYVLEVDASKVAEQGYEFVQFSAVEVGGNAVNGSSIGFLTGLRYKEDDIGTQVT